MQAASTIFNFNQYDEALGGAQTFVVGTAFDGSDLTLTLEIDDPTSPFINTTNQGISTSGVSPDQNGFQLTYSVETNFVSDFQVTANSLFANVLRNESVDFTSDGIISLTAVGPVQANPGNEVLVLTDGSTTASAAFQDGVSTSGSTFAVAADFTGTQFSYTYTANFDDLDPEQASFSEISQFSFDVVPEPTSSALLGLAGLTLLTRRRR